MLNSHSGSSAGYAAAKPPLHLERLAVDLESIDRLGRREDRADRKLAERILHRGLVVQEAGAIVVDLDLSRCHEIIFRLEQVERGSPV
ncbi:MAG: hypothetical protein AAGA81_07515 [Acidobacteriota bacterium]